MCYFLYNVYMIENFSEIIFLAKVIGVPKKNAHVTEPSSSNDISDTKVSKSTSSTSSIQLDNPLPESENNIPSDDNDDSRSEDAIASEDKIKNENDESSGDDDNDDGGYCGFSDNDDNDDYGDYGDGGYCSFSGDKDDGYYYTSSGEITYKNSDQHICAY
jgi:hypothetical protein